MENTFLEFLKRFRYLSPKDLYNLYNIAKLKKYKAGETIVREGDFFKYTLGISKGLIRTYVITHEGEERTVRFAREGQYAGSSASVINNKPSFEYLEVLEDTFCIELDLVALKKLTENNIRILRLWDDGICEAFVEAIDRVQFLTTLSPEQRYRQLLKENPSLINRVQQKHLASYLGITTVSLSRIRSRVLSKD
ncbi:MAG: Crp/Fnr family transcriptional regulator [Bacteroidia bacterium]